MSISSTSSSLTAHMSHSSVSTIQSRRRPSHPSLFLIFPGPPPDSTAPVKSPPSVRITTPTRMMTVPKTLVGARNRVRLSSGTFFPPLPPPNGPSPQFEFMRYEFDTPAEEMSAAFPPTPSPSSHSQSSSPVRSGNMFDSPEPAAQPIAGPSKLSIHHDLPPTPPVQDEVDDSAALNFAEPPRPPRRPARDRRPASTYPTRDEQPIPPPHRKYTDPSAHAARFQADLANSLQQLDLETYSSEYDETRPPTLSFVTTSTADSTTSTPSIGGNPVDSYGFSQPGDNESGKPEAEPRIRVRTNTGRANAYSSAESSTASAGYAYQAYSDSVYNGNAPPVPVLPTGVGAETVGLGIASFPRGSDGPASPVHRPWRSHVINRLRSDSVSSSITTASTATSVSTDPVSTSGHAFTYPFGWAENEQRLSVTEPEAVALVEQGRENIMDRERLDAMGGVEALKDSSSLIGITHLLLPSFGSEILDVLPALFEALASTLVVLDISNNDLSLLPHALLSCTALEELNISGNPLRQLPSFLGDLTTLRMLVADECGLQSLPQDLSTLYSLHTICVRRNRLVALPTWLCLLGNLETLRVDENPFAAQWAPIVAPILTSSPITPVPTIPPAPTTVNSPPPSRSASQRSLSGRPQLRATSSSMSISSIASSREGVVQQPTSVIDFSPNSPLNGTFQLPPLNPIAEDHGRPSIEAAELLDESTVPLADESTGGVPPRTIRKMRSAGALLGKRADQPRPTPSSRDVSDSSTRSAASVAISGPLPTAPSRYASLGSSEGRRAASVMGNYVEEGDFMPPGHRNVSTTSSSSRQSTAKSASGSSSAGNTGNTKWGFLRKMSMSRLKSADKVPSLAASASANIKLMPPVPPVMQHTNSDPVPTLANSAVIIPADSRPALQSSRSVATLPSRRGLSPVATEALNDVGTGGLQPLSALFASSAGQSAGGVRGRRRSFLPIDPTPTSPSAPSLNVAIPAISPFLPSAMAFEASARAAPSPSVAASTQSHPSSDASASEHVQIVTVPVEDPVEQQKRHAVGLESIKSYLRDLFDLSRTVIEPYGGFEVVTTVTGTASGVTSPANGEHSERPNTPSSDIVVRTSVSNARRARRPTLDSASGAESIAVSRPHSAVDELVVPTGKRFKNDRAKRARVIREIVETERTYVRGLDELVSIYVKPASAPVNPSKPTGETVIPLAERKIVFGGVESILVIHRDNFLPALEKVVAPLLNNPKLDNDDEDGELSTSTAHAVGEVFRTYIAYMKQYSTYTNNFDNALSRMQSWTMAAAPMPSGGPGSASTGVNGLSGIAMGKSASSAGSQPGTKPNSPSVSAPIMSPSLPIDSVPHSGSHLTPSQKKRIKTFLKRCRENPRHSQISLDSYLLLPVQRVPRYKMLLEDLAMCTPPRDHETSGSASDALDDALAEIANLASVMNEEKREAESRLRLFHWQQRITSRGPSPLVQPHRRLVLDGSLKLIRLVKKASAFVEVDSALSKPFSIPPSSSLPSHSSISSHGTVASEIDADQTVTINSLNGSSSSGQQRAVIVPIEFLRPEPMDRQLTLILCSDLMVLVQARSVTATALAGTFPVSDIGNETQMDLFSVLRMATLREPASVVNNNILRVVDNKSIYYFTAGAETVLQWSRAINQQSRR